MRTLRVIAAHSPHGALPSKVTPVFFDEMGGRQLFAQIADAQGLVTNFVDVTKYENEMFYYEGPTWRNWEGQPKLMAYAFSKSNVVISDEQNVLEQSVREAATLGFYERHPIAGLEINDLIQDIVQIPHLAELAATKISSISKNVALKWAYSDCLTEDLREHAIGAIFANHQNPQIEESRSSGILVEQSAHFSKNHDYKNTRDNVTLVTGPAYRRKNFLDVHDLDALMLDYLDIPKLYSHSRTEYSRLLNTKNNTRIILTTPVEQKFRNKMHFENRGVVAIPSRDRGTVGMLLNIVISNLTR